MALRTALQDFVAVVQFLVRESSHLAQETTAFWKPFLRLSTKKTSPRVKRLKLPNTWDQWKPFPIHMNEPETELAAGNVSQKWSSCLVLADDVALAPRQEYTPPLLSLAKVTSDVHNLTAILSGMRSNSVTLLLYQPYKGEIQQNAWGIYRYFYATESQCEQWQKRLFEEGSNQQKKLNHLVVN